MTEACPDCDRLFATDAHEQALAAYCATGTGSPSCQAFTITRLRRELAEVNERATEIADDVLGLQPPGQSTAELLNALETGYNSMRIELHRELAEARAIGELERAIVDAALEWHKGVELDADYQIINTGVERLDGAVSALLAARGSAGEKELT